MHINQAIYKLFPKTSDHDKTLVYSTSERIFFFFGSKTENMKIAENQQNIGFSFVQNASQSQFSYYNSMKPTISIKSPEGSISREENGDFLTSRDTL